jgi:signal transduction histidine kinase
MVVKKRFAALQKSEIILLAVVVLAAASIILINYFTIKTLSAARAYVNGESRYSKGQKDAARYLIMFVHTEEPDYWNLYQEELSVPIGDSVARAALTANGPEDIIRQGFLAGRNHADDLDDMIWLFRNFKNVSFMKRAIDIWESADRQIRDELHFAQGIRQKLLSNGLSAPEKTAAIAHINEITNALTLKERDFADTLGATARSIKSLLILANVVMTIFIVGSVALYGWRTMKQLNEKNRALTLINEELDRFVYSASHDLRAPITSQRGLIDILKQEDDPQEIKKYLTLMEQSLERQDKFIHEIIDFSRNKRTEICVRQIDMTQLITDAVNQHQFMDDAIGIEFHQEIHARKMLADELRMKIILNNLLSNAIKYSDPAKDKRSVTIRTRQYLNSFVLQVEDNGLGIKKDDQNRIFEMFYVTNNTKKGTGLGLYIMQETVQKLKGKITVNSEPGQGTTFTVALPNLYGAHV